MTRKLILAVARTALAFLAAVVAARAGDAPTFDRYGRLAAYPGKAAVACPAQDARTAVILAAGQSNIANHAAVRARTAFPGRVVSFYEGGCAEAASPLPGGTALEGEWLTLLGDELIRSGRYDRVVIAPASVGGQPIFRFAFLDLGEMLDATATALATAHYRVTHVLWHQGETDYGDETPPEDYRRAFAAIVARLRAHGVDAAIFVSVATYCEPMRNWSADNPIARVQRSLPDPAQNVWPGADSDAFDVATSRSDRCHLSADGQARMARAQAAVILGRR